MAGFCSEHRERDANCSACMAIERAVAERDLLATARYVDKLLQVLDEIDRKYRESNPHG